MVQEVKFRQIISIIIILIMVFSITGCKSTSIQELSNKYYGAVTIKEENKILGDIILSLFPEEYRSNNVPIIAHDQKYSDLVFTLFNLNPEILESYAILTSKDNSSTDNIAIIVPKIGYEVDVIMGIDNRVVKLLANKDKEEQDKIIETVVLEQYDLSKYLIFIVNDNSDLIYKEIIKGLKDMDSSKVDVIEEISGVIEIKK